MTIAYTYTILRYCHDIATGEQLNVGVAVFAPDTQFLGALCTKSADRISKAFPDMDVMAFESAMAAIRAQFERLSKILESSKSGASDKQTVLGFAREVLPPDDSALKWSPVGGGLTDSPKDVLSTLFERMVLRHDVVRPEIQNVGVDHLLPQGMHISGGGNLTGIGLIGAVGGGHFNSGTSATLYSNVYGVVSAGAMVQYELPSYENGMSTNAQSLRLLGTEKALDNMHAKQASPPELMRVRVRNS